MNNFRSEAVEWLHESQQNESGLDATLAAQIRQTLDMALSAGASAADIVLSESQNHSLKAQGGKIAENKISAARIMGIRVQKEGRLGLSYSESMQEADRRSMVEMALRNAAFTKQDPSQGIHSWPHRKASANGAKDALSAPGTGALLPNCRAQYHEEQIELGRKEELALKLESEPQLREARVSVVPYSGFGESRADSYVANSNGVFCFERSHGYSCYTYVLLEQAGAKADYGEASMARRFAALDWEYCVDTAIAEAALLLAAKPIASGSYDVIFTPEALAALLSCFEVMFSGFAAKTKTNPLRDKLGTQIACENLNIIDMPRYRDSLHCQYFDAEGLVPQDLTLLKDGVLQNFYHNCETAKYFGLESNARAARAAAGGLGTGGNCLLIVPSPQNAGTAGNVSGDIRSDKFLEVMELAGLHSGCDATSGNFSVPCSGKLYRNGVLLQGVRDVTLAGNFYQMLRQLSAIGSQLKTDSSKGFFAPDLRFAGLTVAGE